MEHEIKQEFIIIDNGLLVKDTYYANIEDYLSKLSNAIVDCCKTAKRDGYKTICLDINLELKKDGE